MHEKTIKEAIYYFFFREKNLARQRTSSFNVIRPFWLEY